MTGHETTFFYSGGGSGGGGGGIIIPQATTSQYGIVQLSPDAGTTAPNVVQASDSRLPTVNETQALAGTSGTPGPANPYVTEQSFQLIDGGTF